MNMTITAKPIVCTGPEVLPSGARKYGIALENGSTLVTFSDRAFEAINTHLDQELTFEAEPSDRGGPPKVVKVSYLGQDLYDYAAGKQKVQGGPRLVGMTGGGTPDRETAETARRAVGSAVAIISSAQAALLGTERMPMTNEEMLRNIAELASGIHDTMRELGG